MAIAFIPFDGWSPSSSHFGEGWTQATNLAPVFDSWQPYRRFVAIETASSSLGRMIGTHVHPWPTGMGTAVYHPEVPTLYAGSATRLVTVHPTTGVFTDVSRAANYGAAGTPGGWCFVSIGNDVWATNWFDHVQRRTNNTGLFADGLVSTFKPKPRRIAVIRQHLVWANDFAARPDDWGWSDADDATNMDAPAATSTSLAYKAPPLISTPGQITALIGGQYGLAFKRKSTYFLEYAGPPQVFRAEVMSAHVGTAYASSIINTRHGRFFFGPDGFYRIVGLSEPEKISPPGVDATLLVSLFSTQGVLPAASFEDNQMIGFEVPGMPLVGWLFRVGWDFGGNDQIIFHNPVTGAWSVGTGLAKVAAGDLFTTGIFTLPYAADIWSSTLALTWDGTVARLAPMSASTVATPVLSLRFRPAGLEEEEDKTGAQYRQHMVKGALPIFSRTEPTEAVTPTVTVESLLDPFEYPSASPSAPEIRAWADRNPVGGFYPFQKPGRFFRLSIQCQNDQDFQHFEGVAIEQELLT